MAKRRKKKDRLSGTVEAGRPQPERKWILFLQAFVILAAGWWIFRPALHGDWLWDDDVYLARNPLLYGPERLWKAWFEPGSFKEYYPIEETVQWVQWRLWQNDTFGYHVTNLVLHLISALLVWRLLGKFGLRWAWLGGLVFVVHPVMVESVAWIAELKNTLSLPPFLMALCAWMDYEGRGGRRDYQLALGWYLVAILCKISVVLFPLVILLYAWWKRGRIGWKDFKASLPFFAISLILGMINLWILTAFPNFHSQSEVELAGFVPRLVLIGLALSFCFSKCFLPVDLLPVYPKWRVDSSQLMDYLPWLVMVAVFGALWSRRASWGRHVFLGLGFFLLTLAPCPGFIPPPNMKFAWVMDHFLYIPILGLIGLVVAGLEQMDTQISPYFRYCGRGILTVIVAWLAWESHEYAGKFDGPETLWAYTIHRNPDAWLASYNLGCALLQKGRISDAVACFREALRLYPDYEEAHNNLGNVLIELGQYAEARQHFEKVLRLNPGNASAHNNFGDVLMLQGQSAEAVEQFNEALKLNPDFMSARKNLSNALLHEGRSGEALQHFEEDLRLNPDDAATQHNCGLALARQGQFDEAIRHYQEALRVNPYDAEIHRDCGLAFVQLGRLVEAIAHYQEAVRLKPDYAEAQNDWGWALAQEGVFPEAIGHYREALRLRPGYAEAHSNYGIVLAQTNHLPDAIEQFQEATRLKPDFAVAFCNWGIALGQMGRKTEAIGKFQETLRLDPNNATAQTILAKLVAPESHAPGR